MPGFISKGLLWNLHHDYFFVYVVMHRLLSVHGAIMGKFIAVQFVPFSQDRNPSAWREHVIKKPSMADVTMQPARRVTERI
jgi:hypothetical protein